MGDCSCPSYRQTLKLAVARAGAVAAMVSQGVDQVAASRAVWGGTPLPPQTPAEVPAWVRLVMVLRSPWLRLESGSVAEDFLLWIGCLLATSLVIVVLAVAR